MRIEKMAFTSAEQSLAHLAKLVRSDTASKRGGSPGHLPEAFLLTWIMTIEGGLIGLVISAMCSTAEKALYLFPLTMIPQLLLAGLLIPSAPLMPLYPVQSPVGRVAVVDLPKVPAMTNVLAHVVSPLMVSRWGLEGLSDLYIRDREQDSALRKPYSYELLSAVAITLDGNASAEARTELAGTAGGLKPVQPSETFAWYVAILGGFAFVFVSAIAAALKRKETHGNRNS